MIFCSFRLNLVTIFCGCLAFGTDIVFNATETVHLGKDSIVLSCSVNPTIHVVQLYSIKLSLSYNNNEWRDIVMLRPFGINLLDLDWLDEEFRNRMLSNTSKTENGVLWVKLPADNVLRNDSGTFMCFAKWFNDRVSSSNATKTIEVIELTEPGYTTTFSGSYDSKLLEEQEEKKGTFGWIITLIIGLCVFIAVPGIIILLIVFRKVFFSQNENNTSNDISSRCVTRKENNESCV